MAYFGDPRREFFASDPAAELGSFAWNVFDNVVIHSRARPTAVGDSSARRADT